MESLLGYILIGSPTLMLHPSTLLVRFISYSQPLKLGLLLFHLWLYAEDYQGALLLSSLAKKKISALGF